MWRYLLAILAAETLKKVVSHCVATAFASIVLPVPGGPNIKTSAREYRKEDSRAAHNMLNRCEMPVSYAERESSLVVHGCIL